MTTDWKALCAQLAENVRYLLDCVADGDSDPVAIAECVQRLGATRLLLSQPEPEGLSDRIISIAMAAQECAFAWEPTARLIGNVCAKDIADLCGAVLARWGRPATSEARELLNLLLNDLDALIDSSEGVAGLHLNGDIACWESLRQGGRFETWLMRMDEARAFLDSTMDRPVVESEGSTNEELIRRLLLLAEQAVKEALDFDYGDPEDRHIWRELQELKQLVERVA